MHPKVPLRCVATKSYGYIHLTPPYSGDSPALRHCKVNQLRGPILIDYVSLAIAEGPEMPLILLSYRGQSPDDPSLQSSFAVADAPSPRAAQHRPERNHRAWPCRLGLHT